MLSGFEGYELISISDVIRDGLGLELWKLSAEGSKEMVAEVFRQDPQGTLTLTTWGKDVDLDLICRFIDVARAGLALDGSP